MNQDPYGKEKKIDGSSVANTVVGVLVLTFGVGVAIWVLSVLAQAIGGKELLPVVDRIVTAVAESDSVARYYTELDMTTLGTVAGYLIAILLLYISAGIAKAIIGAGASIMNPDYKKVLTDLKKEFEKGKAGK